MVVVGWMDGLLPPKEVPDERLWSAADLCKYLASADISKQLLPFKRVAAAEGPHHRGTYFSLN